jgi:hypothetical protein
MSEHLYLLDTNVLMALTRADKLGSYIDQRFELRRASSLTEIGYWPVDNWGTDRCRLPRPRSTTWSKSSDGRRTAGPPAWRAVRRKRPRYPLAPPQ